MKDIKRYTVIAFNPGENTIYYHDKWEFKDYHKAFRKHQMGEDFPSGLEEISCDNGTINISVDFNTIDEAWEEIWTIEPEHVARLTTTENYNTFSELYKLKRHGGGENG